MNVTIIEISKSGYSNTEQKRCSMENIGKMLKEKRIERGLTIEQISEKTRLTTKHIKALEEGDISFFKDDLSYLRFFVKSYCEAVGIDFEEIKDELRSSVDDYTMTFTNTMARQHEEMEKHIAETELSKVVKTTNVKSKPKFDKLKTNKKKSKLMNRKPDFSLVSLIAVVSVVAIMLMFAFIVYLNSDKKESTNANTPPTAPVQDGSGENKYPTTDEETKEEETKKELTITKNDTTHYTITGYKEGDELQLATQFVGSNSSYSITVDGVVLQDPKPQVYYAPNTATAKITAKKGSKVQVYFGFLINANIKINDKTVKIDDTIANAGGSATLEFTFGE